MKNRKSFVMVAIAVLIAVAAMLPSMATTAYAIIDGEGWYITDDDILVVTGKLTDLPAYSYASIIVSSSGELALADSTVWK